MGRVLRTKNIRVYRVISSIIFLLLSLGLFVSSAQALPYEINEETLLKVSQSAQWKRLLHFRKKLFRKEQSLVDGSGFFFAENGNTDALAELKASIEAMKSDIRVGKFDLHPQCAFPTRYWFLKKHFNLGVEDEKCLRFEEFLERFNDPQAVSVVFSSAYQNNPASMFGHTFLKISSARGLDLLDTGVNYAAAVPPDENPFAFVYFGVMGGYLGQWSIEPYYNKIQEYIHGENRDLWEYELSLTPEEVLLFLGHLWEIETNSYFKYYFFDENCSFQILAAIEAIRPDWNITDHTIYVIPGESTKFLYSDPSIVRSVNFRPSFERQFQQVYSALNRKEKKEFNNFRKNRLSPENAEHRLSLEALIAFYDYRKRAQKGRLSSRDEAAQQSARLRRAELGARLASESQRLEPIQAETRPDLGHDSYTASLVTGTAKDGLSNGQSFGGFRLKSAYHDLLNNDLGFKKFSHIDFPSIEFRYNDALKKWYLEELTAINITSLPPINILSQKPSWKLQTRLYTPKEFGCLDCVHAQFEIGVGGTVNIWSDDLIVYGLGTARGEASSNTNVYKGRRYGPGLNLGMLYRYGFKYKAHIGYQPFWDHGDQGSARLSERLFFEHAYFVSRKFEVRNILNFYYQKSQSRKPMYQELGFQLSYFFR